VKLATRLTLTLMAIMVILIAPAVYGVYALRELQQVAENLSMRDAVGALSLGRLQSAFREVDNRQRIYLALATDTSGRRAAAERVEEAAALVDIELDQLRSGGYEDVSRETEAAWIRLRGAMAEEQRLILRDSLRAADRVRSTTVDPAVQAMDRSLTPIGEAINEAGITQVRKAQLISQGGATTTVLSLTIALLIALLIGAWTGGKLLRPVSDLRRGMSRVAEGDFSAELPIPLDRRDEIGELARSFTVMSHELAALDRLKAEFVSVASHELKTPLSVIRGYVSLLRDGVYGPVGPDQQKVLGSVGDQTERLGRLIQQLLDISRFEAGVGRLDVRPIDLREFLSDLALSFEALAGQNEMDFAVVVDDSLPATIDGDSDRLNEVVGNLLVNAFKFTPRHGRIILRAYAGPIAGGGVTIEVVDTGVGLPANQLKRVFEKFYQVENEAQPRSAGTGLGLAIAREITEAHGGMISVESRLGKGTTFRVVLPPRPPEHSGVDHHSA
jgi:signal transduction histidine kinase